MADPRRIDLCDFATLHLQQKPGSDIALLNGLMYIILEKGWEAKDFIAERTEEFEEFKATIMDYPPEKASEISGVPVEKLYEAAEIMAASKPMAVMWAMGITQHITGVRNVMSLANLQMLLGNMGVPGGGVNPLRGQNNVQGACDLGGLPNVYPAYQPVTSEAAQQKFQEAWGRTSNTKVGMTATEMIPGVLEGKTHALYILGEDPVMSDPDTQPRSRMSRKRGLPGPAGNLPIRNLRLCRRAAARRFLRRENRHLHQHRATRADGASRPSNPSGTQNLIGGSPPKSPSASWPGPLALPPLNGPFAGWDYPDTSAIMDEINALAPSYGRHHTCPPGSR